MRRVIFALLAPAAVAATLTASASAAVLLSQRPVLDRSHAATDVAYRGVRRTTVRGPRGGVYHSRTMVRGGRYYGAGRVYAGRGYVRGGYYGPRYYGARYYGHRYYAGYYGPRYYGHHYAGYYGPRYYGARYYGPRVYASRGFYGHRGVYARGGFYGHRTAYRGGGRVYASRMTGVRRR